MILFIVLSVLLGGACMYIWWLRCDRKELRQDRDAYKTSLTAMSTEAGLLRTANQSLVRSAKKDSLTIDRLERRLEVYEPPGLAPTNEQIDHGTW